MLCLFNEYFAKLLSYEMYLCILTFISYIGRFETLLILSTIKHILGRPPTQFRPETGGVATETRDVGIETQPETRDVATETQSETGDVATKTQTEARDVGTDMIQSNISFDDWQRQAIQQQIQPTLQETQQYNGG